MTGRRWWMYDRPLLRDWLFLAALTVGAVWALLAIVDPRDSVTSTLIRAALRIAMSLFVVGLVGATIRDYVRKRRYETSQANDRAASTAE